MSRLIDADKLLDKFNQQADMVEALTNKADDFRMFCKLADAVEEAPTVDAVEVVRCKHCKYFCREQVRLADGTTRDKLPNEGLVSLSVGMNIGSHCNLVDSVNVSGYRYGEHSEDTTLLWRNEEDFCSRGERKK